jgi:mRNA interferase MazF
MATFTFGDVVLIDFPFSDRPVEKRRPGLVIAQDPHGDLLLARITSKPAEFSTDIPILHWRLAGLNIPSTVRLLKMATTHDSFVLRSLGRLDSLDLDVVIRGFRTLIANLERDSH